MIDPSPILDEIEGMLEEGIKRNDTERLNLLDDLQQIQKLKKDINRLKEDTAKVEEVKATIDDYSEQIDKYIPNEI